MLNTHKNESSVIIIYLEKKLSCRLWFGATWGWIIDDIFFVSV